MMSIPYAPKIKYSVSLLHLLLQLLNLHQRFAFDVCVCHLREQFNLPFVLLPLVVKENKSYAIRCEYVCAIKNNDKFK